MAFEVLSIDDFSRLRHNVAKMWQSGFKGVLK